MESKGVNVVFLETDSISIIKQMIHKKGKVLNEAMSREWECVSHQLDQPLLVKTGKDPHYQPLHTKIVITVGRFGN